MQSTNIEYQRPAASEIDAFIVDDSMDDGMDDGMEMTDEELLQWAESNLNF